MGRLRVTGSLGPSRGDNWDSTKARSSQARPRPLGAQKGPGRGARGGLPQPPLPHGVHPASRPGSPHFRGEQGGAGRPALPATLSGPSPGVGGSSWRPRAEAAGGSLRYDTWGRRWTGQRRPRRLEAEARAEEEVPGTPPPIVPARPAARNGPAPPGPRSPGTRPVPALTLQRPALPAADATYPGKARAGPGSEPTDKK